MRFYIGSGLKNHEAVNHYAAKLEENGWQHTYDWTRNIEGDKSIENLINLAESERQGIAAADVVIILLPAGRGTHIELGMAIALHKKTFLCSAAEEEFSVENTVNFYQLPDIVRLTGTPDENIERIRRSILDL